MANKNADPVIEISNFNQGGLSFSKWSGLKDSVYRMIGFDPHSLPGVLQVEQKMTKNSGATVTELCKVAVNCSNGIRYWFSSTSGKVWQDKAGAWTLVYTTSPAAGGTACLGGAEYYGYIYWATESRLHRIPVATADGSTAWTTYAVPNWQTFDKTDASFHPMVQTAGLVLYIGDGNQVAQVDAKDTNKVVQPIGSETWSSNALDIRTPLRVKSLGQYGTDLLVGTYVADTVTQTEIIRWNTWSVSFTTLDPVPEIGINAFLRADNMVLVQAGNKGNIYSYDGQQLVLWGKIPGEYSSTATGEVYPDSVANKEGQILFGFSNITGNPTEQGIYRIGRHSSSFLYIMDLPYPISERSGSDFVTTGLSIGAILVVGSDIYVSWKNGASYGVDKLDTSLKLDGAYIETLTMSIEREKFTNFVKSIVNYASLPTSTDVLMYLSKNYGAYGTVLNSFNDTDRNIIESKDEGIQFTTLQLKLKITASGNTAPLIESAGVFV